MNGYTSRRTMKNLDITKSKELYSEAAAIIPSGSQTMSKRPEVFAKGAFPMYLQKGSGCYVFDVDGNKYLDYIGALGPITLGYAYPTVNAAVEAQLEAGSIFSLMHPVEVEAARAVIDVVPCAEMVRFLKTGAEATSAAVRIARAYTEKELILNSGYHGWLDTWAAEYSGREAGVPDSLRELIVGFTWGDYDSENSLRSKLEEHKGRVACIITEPSPYNRTDAKEYLQWVRALADEYDIPLIFDEIVTGFRLALGGAQEYFGVIPDIACFAKGISNGLPVAVVAGKREFMEVATTKTVISSTYGGDALSLAAVVASIREYREKDVFAHTHAMGSRLMDGFNRLGEKTGLRLSFKGYPPMSLFAFEYDDPGVNQDLMTLFLQEMAKRGILFRRGGLNMITFSHTPEDIDKTLDAGQEVVELLGHAYGTNTIKEHITVEKVGKSIRQF